MTEKIANLSDHLIELTRSLNSSGAPPPEEQSLLKTANPNSSGAPSPEDVSVSEIRRVTVASGDPHDHGEYDLASRVINLKPELTNFRVSVPHRAVLPQSLVFLARLHSDADTWEILDSVWDVDTDSGWAQLTTEIPYQIAIGQVSTISGWITTPLDERVMYAVSPVPTLNIGDKTCVTLYIFNELFEELVPPGSIIKTSNEPSTDVLRRNRPVTMTTKKHPGLLGSGLKSSTFMWDGRILQFDFEVEGAVEGPGRLEFNFSTCCIDLGIDLKFEVV